MPDLEWSVGKCYYTEINFVKIFIFERFIKARGAQWQHHLGRRFIGNFPLW